MYSIWFCRVKINNYSNYISSDIGCCLSDKINSYVEGQPYSWHVNTNSSNVISTLTNNLNQTLNLIKTLTLFIPFNFTNISIVWFIDGLRAEGYWICIDNDVNILFNYIQDKQKKAVKLEEIGEYIITS